MRDSNPCLSHYLVEWYRDSLRQDALDDAFAMLTTGARLTSAEGASATVVLTITVPADDVVYCIVSATCREVVAEACDRAGIPAQRVTPAMVAA